MGDAADRCMHSYISTVILAAQKPRVGMCRPESGSLGPLRYYDSQLLKHSYEQEVTVAAVYTHNIHIMLSEL
jgi:hypothetical protein